MNLHLKHLPSGIIHVSTSINIPPLANGRYRLVRSCLMFQVLFLCFIRIFPVDSIKYVLDVINIYITAKLLTCYPYFDDKKKCNLMIFLLPNVAYCAVGTCSFLGSIPHYGADIMLYLWSLRAYFRYAIFGCGCIAFLENRDRDKLFRILEFLFVINLGLVIFQYIVLGKRADYLNGMFGTAIGGNTFSNMYMLLMTANAFVKWMQGKKKGLYLALICGSCLLIATLSELKVYYVELICIYALTFLFVKKDIKKLAQNLLFIIIGIVVLQYMLKILYELYPDFDDFMNVQSIIERSSKDRGYTGRGDINRLNAFSKINSTIFADDFLSRLVGVGLGNANSFDAGFLSSRSQIAVQYEYLHYSWFSHAFMYVECGIVGVLFYAASFAIPIFIGYRRIRKGNNDPYCVCGLIVAVIACGLMIYNETLKVEAAYFTFFMISAVYINEKPNTMNDIMKKCLDRKIYFDTVK